jgi:hypothetical protein
MRWIPGSKRSNETLSATNHVTDIAFNRIRLRTVMVLTNVHDGKGVDGGRNVVHPVVSIRLLTLALPLLTRGMPRRC